MSIARERLNRLIRIAAAGAIVCTAATLVGTGLLIWRESTWVAPEFREPEGAFRHGTIGTELMPLPVAQVLPGLFPQHFQPGGADSGDWIEQFGFTRSAEPDGEGLPVGFVVSNYRPQSASPSPLAFVGFSCALCHHTKLETSQGAVGGIIYGPGNASMNLFAWIDAFQASLLEREPPASGETAGDSSSRPYRLTAEMIRNAYREKSGRELTFSENAMLELWLRQIRSRLDDGLARFDEPYGGARSRLAEFVPTGPVRTQPFRTLIRSALVRPGNDMTVYTKIATVFSEDRRTWAQFDGTIADIDARSSMAAFAAGATVENMSRPEIAHNIRKASEFTKTLRPPKFADLFPERAAELQTSSLERGEGVYRRSCATCHGRPDGTSGAWTPGPRHGDVVPLREIGTDAERVLFRHYEKLPDLLFRSFPDKHPFHFQRERMRPLPGDETKLEIRGYVNAPIDGAFIRAPYLHNASVLTLAELINLKPRRDVFFRGRNFYDPADVGFESPAVADARHYFRFDAGQPGNSNRGHDYPWKFDDPSRNEDDLRALLDYLKTL